jgi:F-type H+-transporting ATPase subunit b
MLRSWPTVLALLLALAVVAGAPSLALAKDDAGGGEPNIFEPRLDLTIWTIVVFLLLLGVLWKFAWGPMLRALQKREQTIHDAIDEAHRARDEAHQLREQLQQEMGRAQDKVRELMDEARRDAQHLTEDMTAKARAEIQADWDRKKRELELARDQALQDIYNQAAHLATVISSKVVRRNLSEQDHRALVDEALGDLRRAADEKRR